MVECSRGGNSSFQVSFFYQPKSIVPKLAQGRWDKADYPKCVHTCGLQSQLYKILIFSRGAELIGIEYNYCVNQSKSVLKALPYDLDLLLRSHKTANSFASFLSFFHPRILGPIFMEMSPSHMGWFQISPHLWRGL